jgi:flagellar basal-body rod protein FlgB
MHIAQYACKDQLMEIEMAINLDGVLGIHVQALELRAYRAQLLATNIANADTPNYKAVDVDFKAALSKAQSGDLPLAVTNAGQIQANTSEGSNYQVMYRVPMQPALDGNTVDTQIEQAAFTRNAVQHQASLMFLSGRIKGILTAIKGQ